MATFCLLVTLLIGNLHGSEIYAPTEGEGPFPGDDTKVNAPFITCYEQNKYTYGGYHDVDYRDNPEFPGYTDGDVCDHTSPTTEPRNVFVRNVCKFEVRLGDCVSPFNVNGGGECIKTWSRKCAIHTEENGSDCPEGWEDAEDGCVTTTQNSIVCCCKEDFCNKYMDRALLGWADESNACEVDLKGGCLGLQNVKDPADEAAYADDGNVDSVKYTVTVVDAKDLEDEDDDFWIWTRTSDPYVEIYAYIDDGEDYKKSQTSVIDSTLTPVWNEDFLFDEGAVDGEYTKFIFKVYDDDSLLEGVVSIFEADFLGETKPFYTDSVVNCEDVFSEEMTLYRNDVESGSLFVEVSKEGCSDSDDSDEKDDEKEKGKNKRRLKGKGNKGKRQKKIKKQKKKNKRRLKGKRKK